MTTRSKKSQAASNLNPATAGIAGRPTDAFKDTMGRWRSRSLFVEYEDPDYPPFFTLAEQDDPRGYISLKAKYLEYADPTEYIFARKIFGSWEPWEKILASDLLRDHVALWRVELAKKLESEALSRVRAIADDPAHPQHLAGAKLLLQHLAKKKPTEGAAQLRDLLREPATGKTLPKNPGLPKPYSDDDWNRVFTITTTGTADKLIRDSKDTSAA